MNAMDLETIPLADMVDAVRPNPARTIGIARSQKILYRGSGLSGVSISIRYFLYFQPQEMQELEERSTRSKV